MKLELVKAELQSMADKCERMTVMGLPLEDLDREDLINCMMIQENFRKREVRRHSESIDFMMEMERARDRLTRRI